VDMIYILPKLINMLNKLLLTSGFTQAGVYARRQFCGNLEVYRPPEPLWNPRLREAATTLHAIAGQRPQHRKLPRKEMEKKFFEKTDTPNLRKKSYLCAKIIK